MCPVWPPQWDAVCLVWPPQWDAVCLVWPPQWDAALLSIHVRIIIVTNLLTGGTL